MKQNKQDLDAIIDRGAFAVRDEEIENSIIEASAARVWARVSHAVENSRSATSYWDGNNKMNTNTEQIRGCEDFQSLMPAFVEGKLSNARKLLLEDHANECIPCRQELRAQHTLAVVKSQTYVVPRH